MPNETSTRFLARKRLIVTAIAACFASAPAWGNPTAPQVVNGSASFNQAGKLLTVTNSNGAIINWNTFSVGAGETTRFNQASTNSSVLNRVIANDPSALLGTLSSNGKVWLVNPAGIMVGQGAKIDVGGFIASTLNVRNEDFLAGRLNFGATPNAGRIENRGQITTPSGGSVYLVAPAVENHGIINAPNGEVILAAGQTVQLVDTGTPGVKVDIKGAEGKATNLGEIIAEAGRIGMAGVLVKNSGTLNASSLVKEGGRIFLKASKDAYVDGPGHIVATGTRGGSIEVLGNRVAVMDRAQLDASGETGGGTVLVGGDYQGRNPEVLNAGVTYVGSQASIKANAIQNGDGGKVIVWADDTTRAHGNLSAKGGVNGGNGGFIETSAHHLDVAGVSVNAQAPKGTAGRWLLDPIDVTIAATVDTGGALAGTAPSIWTPSATGSTITNTTIQTALNADTSVTITTTGALSQAGDINVNAPIAKTAGAAATLTLQADNNININQSINSTVGALNLNLISRSGATNLGATTITLNGGTMTSAFGAGVNTGVVNLTAGTATLNAEATISKLNLTGGTLAGSFTNNGTVTVSGGTGTITGAFTNAASGTINITSAVELDQTLSVPNGMGNAGTINLGNAWQNSWSTHTSALTVGGTGLANSGSINSIGTSGLRSLTANILNNTGSINVTSAPVLNIVNNGNTLDSSAGTLNAAAGSILRILGGTTVLGAGSVMGAGGGTVDFANSTTLPVINVASNFTHPANTVPAPKTQLTFGGDVTVNGSGTFINNGSLNITSDTLAGPFTNNGTISVGGGTGTIAGAFTNAAGGTINITSGVELDQTLSVTGTLTSNGAINLGNAWQNSWSTHTSALSTDAVGVIVNASGGSINTTGTSGIRAIAGNLTNSAGTLNVAMGTPNLNINGNGFLFDGTGGTINVGSANALNVNGGVTQFGLGTTITGAGVINFLTAGATNPTLNLPSNFTNGGNIVMRNTTVNGPGTLINGVTGTLDIITNTLASPFTNNGTISVGGGTGTITGAFTNAASGTINITSAVELDQTLSVPNGMGNAGTINLGNAWQNSWSTHTSALTVGGTGLANSGSINSIGTSGLRSLTANTLNNTGSINVNYGTLGVTGTLIQSGTINVATGMTFSETAGFTNNGTLTGKGTISVGVGAAGLTNQGIINPGGDGTPGTLAISGDLIMAAGSKVNVDLMAPTAGNYDVLNVSGTATLSNGTLNLKGVGGAGAYPVLTATGGFGATTFGTIDSGTFTQTPAYAATSLTLNTTANALAGSIYWTGSAATGNWADALNWSNSLAPTSANSLYIGAGAGTVSVATLAQAANSLYSDASLTLATGGALTLTTASTINGTLAMSGGTLTANAGLTAANYTQNGGTLNIGGATLLKSTGSMAVNGAIASNVGGSLTLQAVNNIALGTGGSIAATVAPLNVVLNSNSTGTDGAISMASGSSITSNGGNITLGGGTAGNGTGNAIGNASYTEGIYVTGATLDAGGGNIALNGTGFAGTSSADGIYVTGTSLIQTSGAGTIALNGTGGAGTDSNAGVRLGTSASISSVDGAISITGQGAGSGVWNYGLYVHDGATIGATGAGTITLNGTGSAAGTTSNSGVRISASGGATQVTSASGNISITGIGGGDGDGLQVSSGAVVQSNTGGITLSGTSGTGTTPNWGDYGVFIGGPVTSLGGGNIQVTGTSTNVNPGTNSNHGIRLNSGAQVVATGAGTITMTGQGARDGSGLKATNAALIQSATGAITLTGTGGAGTSDNLGVYLDTSAQVSTVDGAVTLTGHGGAATGASNYGVYLTGGGSTSGSSITSTGTGTITLDGTGGGGTDSNYGVRLSTGMHITSTTGDILIKGQGGGTGAGTNNYGIILTGASGAAITSNGSANITLDGRGKGGAAGVNTNAINGSHTTGNVTLIADTDSGTDSIILTGPISGTGALLLEPLDAATTIGIAGGAGAFNLSSADLNTIQPGFASLTVGRTNGTGPISFGNGGAGYTFNANTVIRNPGLGSGGITVTGPISAGASGLTLNSGSTIDLGATALANLGGALTLTSGGDIQMRGDLSTTATGLSAAQNAINIQAAGRFIFSGSGGISADSGSIAISGANGVELDNGDWGTIAYTALAGDVTISSTNGDVSAVGGANITGQNVSLSAANGMVQLYGYDGGNVHATVGNATITSGGGGVDLGTGFVPGVGNIFSITAAGIATINSGGAITNSGGNGSMVTANTLGATAVGGIELTTQVANLDTSNTGAGNTLINNTGTLTVNGMTDASGSITLNNAGSMTLSGMGMSANGIFLTASGAASDIVVNSELESTNGMTVDAGRDLSVGPFYGKLIAFAGTQTINVGRDMSVIQDNGSAYVESGSGLQTITVGRDLLVQVNNTSGLEAHIESSGGQTISVGRDLTMNALDSDQTRINAYGGNQLITVGGNMTLNAASDIAHVQSTAGSQTINVTGNLSMSGSSSWDNAYLFGATGQSISVGGNFSMQGGTGAADIVSNGSISVAALSLHLDGGISAGEAGRWLIYAPNPGSVTKGGLVPTLYQYNTAYGGTVASAGSGFVYASQVRVDANLSGTLASTFGSSPTATPGYLLRGLDSDDTLTPAAIAGTAAFSNWPITTSTAAGSYSLHYTSGLSAPSLPYTLTLAQGTSQTYTVDPAAVSIVAIDASLTGTASKVYDGTPTATLTSGNFALTGFVNSDSASVTKTSGTYASKNVGSNILVSTTLTSGDFSPLGSTNLSNYTLPTSASGNIGVITPASLTVSGVTAQNKVYDATTAATIAGTAALSGVIGTDAVTLGGSASGSFADKNVGVAKPVTVTGLSLSGADAGNYVLSTTGASTKADITPASLTVSGLTAQNKVYDATKVATITGTAALSGILGADVVALGGSASATFDNKNVGSAKPVTVTGLTLAGADAGNYTLSNATAATSADITARALNVTAKGVAKVYDGQTSATVSYADNRMTGDVLTTGGSAKFFDKNVGIAKPVNVSGITLTGTDAGNYTFNTTAATTADITVRPLSTWKGGASGNWSEAANWDALPDLSNVLAVSVPVGSVTYDAAAGSTNLASLTAAGLAIAGGSLNIANSLTVSSSFSQSGGALGFEGSASASITQASGNLNLPALTLANLSLAAPAGAITQSGALVAAALNTQSQTGTTLTDAGNKIASFTAANSGSGNVALTNTGALTITGISNSGGNITLDNTGAVTTVGAVSAPAGAVLILAHSPLNIGAAGVSAAGSIALTAGATAGSGDTLTLTGPISSTGSSIALFAGDDLVQNANVTTNGGSVSALSQTGNISMALGTTTSTGGGSIGYTASSGNVVLTSLDAGSGAIALNAGKSIQPAAGFAGANLTGGSAVIAAGGSANLSTQVRLLDVTIEGKFSVTDVLTGSAITDAPVAAPVPTSTVPVFNQVLSTVVATTQQQPTLATSQTTTPVAVPPPVLASASGSSGLLLLANTTQTIGGTANSFGSSSVVDSLPATSAGSSLSAPASSGTAAGGAPAGSSGVASSVSGSSGSTSGTASGSGGDKPAADKPAADKPFAAKQEDDKSAGAKKDDTKAEDKKEDKKKDEETPAKKAEGKPAAKKLATCS